ncbi:hypothetical protein ONZ45_g5479 [Pleurotus djamor]|nr:hypothetical protein ONZ45_g5479 [Pleurotus djamor]
MLASHTPRRPLTPENRHELRQLLLQDQRNLQLLDNQLLTVACSDNLLHERNVVYRHIEAYLALLSPIQSMPIYIVQEIFSHCLPNDRFNKPNALKAPLSLAQVCSSWRNLVLTTPMLWKSFFIILGPSNVAARTELAKLWFQRSGQHQLDISIYAPSVGTQLSPLLELLANNIHRVRHISLILQPIHVAPVSDLFSRRAPLLSTVDVTFSKAHDLWATPSCTVNITPESAPRLRAMTWCTRSLVSQMFSFNTTAIVDLNIEQLSLSADQCLPLLRNCPELRSAQLQVVTSPILHVDPSQHVIHHSLETLTIYSTVPLGSLFDHLTLPSLETLTIADANLDFETTIASSVWQPAAFADFVERSQCDITSLRFSQVLESDSALIACLQATSHSLVSLQLSDIRGVAFPMSDRVLQLLTARDTADGRQTCLCPKLETIKFGTCLLSTDGILANMMESRWIAAWQGKLHRQQQSIARPKYMNPRLDAARNPQDVKMLHNLRGAGLRIV